MAVSWKFVQSLIREATEDAAFNPVADIATAYAKLRHLQRGTYELVTGSNGQLLISSTTGDTSFSFALPQGTGPGDIIESVETALQLIEGKTVAEARLHLLQRRKNTRGDFSGLLDR